MKDNIRYILLLITILLIAGLSVANFESVKVSYLFGEFQLPLIILILLSVLLGSIGTFLISMPKNFSLKQELKKAKKELQTAHQKTEVKKEEVS
ncbi:LapA family protein [Streptococcus pneumoniae]